MNRFRPKKPARTRKTPFVLLGAGLLVLISFLVYFSGNSEDAGEPTGSSEAKLEISLEDISRKIGRMETQDREFSEFMNRVQHLEASLSARMDQIEDRQEKLEKKLAVVSKQPSKPVTSKSTKTKTRKKQRRSPLYHEVLSGETLYLIGGRYDLSVRELVKLNNITYDAVIHPGQKLIVGYKTVE